MPPARMGRQSRRPRRERDHTEEKKSPAEAGQVSNLATHPMGDAAERVVRRMVCGAHYATIREKAMIRWMRSSSTRQCRAKPAELLRFSPKSCGFPLMVSGSPERHAIGRRVGWVAAADCPKNCYNIIDPVQGCFEIGTRIVAKGDGRVMRRLPFGVVRSLPIASLISARRVMGLAKGRWRLSNTYSSLTTMATCGRSLWKYTSGSRVPGKLRSCSSP